MLLDSNINDFHLPIPKPCKCFGVGPSSPLPCKRRVPKQERKSEVKVDNFDEWSKTIRKEPIVPYSP